MTTNKTIDGVPHEVLSNAFEELPDWNTPAATKLRALLDAESAPCAKSQAEPARPAQGEPVVLSTFDRTEWMQIFDADLWTDWMGDDSITSEILPAWMDENGVPRSLPSNQLSRLLQSKIRHLEYKLNEHPAPTTEDEREKAIDEISEAINRMPYTRKHLAECLYDAGYRKQVTS
ncbi:hypothetical protein [Pseudomonas fluorescens]|uniref:hypothetical protein n=1 Tax=Pseudomonas fluorescens TaxID=294 RepID=UPI001BEC0102|nr:hypothetical protein [Pseudomonas fluorescens]MBT2371962.1 hypothetical protein [Pseudomonas fluorescens]